MRPRKEAPPVRASAPAAPEGQWIWSDPSDPAPKNRLTYFRKSFELPRPPRDAALRFAADSNARLWINGRLVRRKVARYHEEKITAEVIDAAPYLHRGANVVVVLHHNWGKIRTFQRSGNRHAGLWVSSPWLKTDATWRCLTAPEFLPHEQQIVGVIGDARIRYPLILDGRRSIPADLHSLAFDDSAWAGAIVVADGPWPATPRDVETPGQREYAVGPLSVLGAGRVERAGPIPDDPLSIAAGIRASQCLPDAEARRNAERLLCGQPAVVAGGAGETHYLTVDFGRPVHGYPFLALAEAPVGTRFDFGYAEICRALYDGQTHVSETGWLNPEGVVGKGYADRYTAREGPQSIELPDERTARWLTLHIHLPCDGRVVLSDLGIVQSQYPVERLGSFACGDERIDQIVQLCLIHAEVTMTDAYVDTPGREDGQWLEDARPRTQLAARWFGDAALRQLLIRTHAEAQGQDGDLHPFAPSNFPAYPASFDWGIQWVAMLYDDYLWTGDDSLVWHHWDTLKRYWRRVLEHVNEDGLWVTPRVLADIRVGLHPGPGQSSGIVTPFVIERLRWSAQMAEAIGEAKQARDWQWMANRMAGAFRRFHLVPANEGVPVHVGDRSDPTDPTDPTDPSSARGFSQAGQTVAVYTELLKRDEALAAVDYAFREPDGSPPPGVTRWNNPTYAYRALRALSHVGLTERAVQHLIERYAPYLPGHPRNSTPPPLQGSYGGPLPEYWISREDLGLPPGEIDRAQPADETGSHGWGAVPLLWLHEALLGVEILDPGGSRLRIAPQTGGLPFVQGHTVTPRGLVWVSWDPQAGRLEVRLPSKVGAEVVAPSGHRGRPIVPLEIGGRIVSSSQSAVIIKGQGRYLFAL